MKIISLSIRSQLVITFIIIFSFIVFIVTYFNFSSSIEQKKDSFLQNSLIEANLLAEFSVTPLIFNDIEGAEETLNKLNKDHNILRVIIFDNDKNIPTLALEFEVEGIDDWYLPSIDELDELITFFHTLEGGAHEEVGGFSYWSSSLAYDDEMWEEAVFDQSQDIAGINHEFNSVRVIRQF